MIGAKIKGFFLPHSQPTGILYHPIPGQQGCPLQAQLGGSAWHGIPWNTMGVESVKMNDECPCNVHVTCVYKYIHVYIYIYTFTYIYAYMCVYTWIHKVQHAFCEYDIGGV